MASETCFREAYAFVFESTRRSSTSLAKDGGNSWVKALVDLTEEGKEDEEGPAVAWLVLPLPPLLAPIRAVAPKICVELFPGCAEAAPCSRVPVSPNRFDIL